MKVITQQYQTFCQKLIAMFFLCAASGLQAAVDIDAGKTLYESCAACHGPNAEGNPVMAAPRLAGQWNWYLERQIKQFKEGIRGVDKRDHTGAQMLAAVQVLVSDEAVSDISAYLASLSFEPVASPVEGDLRNGNNYYQSKCGACHGGNAEGNAMLNSPRLNGLEGDYLVRQYYNFQKGLRGIHPSDRYGKQMKMMANSLATEKNLQDVVAFIHSLPPNKDSRTGGH